MLKRPDHIQTAALVYRVTPKGIQILTVTSRGTKRWILPKGWPMEGKTLIQAAQTEAWEEAGLVNVVSPAFELGTFKYMKHLETGLPVPVVAHTFAFETDANGVVVVSFMFTRCPDVCPILTQSLTAVEVNSASTAVND